MSQTDKPAYSIAEFCKAHGISRSYFYELDRQGMAPRTMHLGRRRLVSKEEAARWRELLTERGSGS